MSHTIITAHQHGFRPGDVVRITGIAGKPASYRVTAVQDHRMTLRPARWYVRLWGAVRRAGRWLRRMANHLREIGK
jgi:hypothetical protein